MNYYHQFFMIFYIFVRVFNDPILRFLYIVHEWIKLLFCASLVSGFRNYFPLFVETLLFESCIISSTVWLPLLNLNTCTVEMWPHGNMKYGCNKTLNFSDCLIGFQRAARILYWVRSLSAAVKYSLEF